MASVGPFFWPILAYFGLYRAPLYRTVIGPLEPEKSLSMVGAPKSKIVPLGPFWPKFAFFTPDMPPGDIFGSKNFLAQNFDFFRFFDPFLALVFGPKNR